jgi:T-complex protein 1 subunit beta
MRCIDSLQDLLNIARTTLSSKILTHDKDHFAELAVDAVLRLKGSTNLESINIIKKPGGTLRVSSSCKADPLSTYVST